VRSSSSSGGGGQAGGGQRVEGGSQHRQQVLCSREGHSGKAKRCLSLVICSSGEKLCNHPFPQVFLKLQTIEKTRRVPPTSKKPFFLKLRLADRRRNLTRDLRDGSPPTFCQPPTRFFSVRSVKSCASADRKCRLHPPFPCKMYQVEKSVSVAILARALSSCFCSLLSLFLSVSRSCALSFVLSFSIVARFFPFYRLARCLPTSNTVTLYSDRNTLLYQLEQIAVSQSQSTQALMRLSH